MKEATGELNMTVIIVITIGALSAFFFSVIWPKLNSNLKQNASCSDAVCKCTTPYCTGSGECHEKAKNGNRCKMVNCTVKVGNEKKPIVCPFKG